MQIPPMSARRARYRELVTSEGCSVDVDTALTQVATFDGRSEIRSAIRLLMAEDREKVEPALFDIMQTCEARHGDPFWVASRILAERDPERDPEYLLRYIHNDGPITGDSLIRRWVRKVDLYPPVTAFVYGLSRLRRFDPVHTYGKLLDEPVSFNRMYAASALGDTADPAALALLVKALTDPKRVVRGAGVTAVRRLGHSVSAAVVLEHPTCQELVAIFDDKDRRIALGAAFTFADLGDVEPVREYVRQNPRPRSRFKRALAGDIPSLPPSWPGDETV